VSKLNWKSTLGAVAPALATALGGPMAGMAAGVAVKALGLQDHGEASNIESVAAAVASGDPNVFLKLREAEQEYLLEMERLGLEHEKVHATDRGSARDMAAKTGVAPQVVLSTVYTVGYFWLLYELTAGEITISADIKPLVNTLMGVMTAAQVQIMNFWFGSSAGSKQKTQVMAR
jgi:hypothetical protein